MSRKVTILRRLSLWDGVQKPSSNTSIERGGQMRKNLRVLDLKPTTCRLLLILCGLVVLLVGVPYSAEAGKPSKQEPIRMDVILGPGGLDLDPCVLVDPPEDCVIQGDSSVISGDDERSFIDPA